MLSFESFETALEYAKDVSHRFDAVKVEHDNGDVLATLGEEGVVYSISKTVSNVIILAA